MLGKAAVAMWWDIAPEMQAECEDWHSHEHMPERLAIPGFLRGTRWIALSGEPSYFVLYEAARLATITGGAYLERLNNPTPWSRKMMPHHRNMVRSLCRVRASFGGGVAHAVATMRFSPYREARDCFRSGSSAMRCLRCRERKGLTGAHLLESQPMPRARRPPSRRSAAATRPRTGCCSSAATIRGRAGRRREPAEDRRARCAWRLARASLGLYRPAYSLVPKDLA